MESKNRHPRWWQLYVMLLLLVGLFWPELQLQLAPAENIIAQLGILLLIFGFVQLWLRANRSALMDLDQAEGKWEMKEYEFPPLHRALTESEPGRDQEGPLQIPAGAVKGVLSDTFEWQSPERDSSVFAEREAVSRKEYK